jgi:replicative DNA helicase
MSEDLKNSPRRVSEIAPRIDRLPPHAIEAEQGVLGCLLMSPRDCISDALQTLTAAHFYDLRHRTLWDTMVEMFEDEKAIDLVTVAQVLKDRKQIDGIGGLGYLSQLPDMVPSAANLEYYINIVHEKFLLRSAINLCTDVISRVYELEGEVCDLLNEFESNVHALCHINSGRKERKIKDIVQESISRIEMLHERQGEIIGLPTGLVDFDKMTWGMQEGQMIIVAARPSVGKTAWLTQVIDHVAIEKNVPAAIFSFETTDTNLVTRMLCSRARVNLRKIRDGFISERDFPKLAGSAGKISKAPIHVIEASGWSIQRVRSKARQLHAQGVRLLGLDYLQLVQAGTGKKFGTREQEVAYVSSNLKAMALELHVPVIVLAQLNREIDKRGPESQPRMSDLRESGQLEQDADILSFLYRKPQPECEEPENTDHIAVNQLIAKQKDGPIGEFELTFFKPFTRFECVARVAPDDVPAEA